MKSLNYLNYFFMGTPLFLVCLGFLTNESSGNLTGCGILFTILTGLYQVVIGIQMLKDDPKDKGLQFYITAVITFFLLWIVNGFIIQNEIIYLVLFFTPIVLAFYFTILLYKKAEL